MSRSPSSLLNRALTAQYQGSKSGRKSRSVPIVIPNVQDLQLPEQSHEKQADILKHDAYQFARLLGRDIRIKLRDNNEKGLRELVWSWGVAADKVLGSAEVEGLRLFVPTQLLDKLVLGINIKPSDTPKVVITPTPAVVKDKLT